MRGAHGRGGLGSVIGKVRLGFLITLGLWIGTGTGRWSRGWWYDGRWLDVFGGDGFELAVAEPAGADIGAEAEGVGFALHEWCTGGGGVEGEGGGV